MTKYTRRSFILIPASKQADANSALETAGYGPNTFSVPRIPRGSSDGTKTPTHYICNWAMTPEQRTEIDSILRKAKVNAIWHDRTHADPAQGTPKLSDVHVTEDIKRIKQDR